MDQLSILPQVALLCRDGKYDKAIALTNKIENKNIAIRAHLLCIEHERRRQLDEKKH